ncbi:MAG: type II secretion system F family protein [Chloroflexi bacterium]|nr:type II secretion system F family protein [Chloroflexota bacterium]
MSSTLFESSHVLGLLGGSDDLLIVLAPLCAALAVACLAYGVHLWAARVRLAGRIEAFVSLEAVMPRSAFDEPSFQVRAVAPVVQALGQFAKSLLPDRQVERIRKNLMVAGMPMSRHLTQFLAAQMALAAVVAAGLVLYLWSDDAPLLRIVVAGIVGAVLGYYLPIIWLGRRMAQRQLAVLRALPDALDLLSISVSAGLGFDGALMEVVRRWRNPLTQELAAVLRDMKLGTSRRDALRAFATRTRLDEVTNFVAAVVQADELGAPMREVLLIQAEQMRIHRRQRAEELARKAVIKMLIPMVMFIFPAMFIVILGPAVPGLMTFMG